MGLVRVIAQIGVTNDDLREMEFIVDTGALLTILSPQLCDELHLDLRQRERVITADSRESIIPVGSAHLKIDGREGAILVGQMDVPYPLLGAIALESLGFKVNPVDGTLEPTRPFPQTPALGTP